MQLFAPFGFYGSGNIGDEASLKGFAALVAQSPRPMKAAIASQDAAHTRMVEPAFRYVQYEGKIAGLPSLYAAHSARAYVFPGGTPIMDGLGEWPLTTLAPMIEHGANWSKPSVFIGVGTERLERPESRTVFTGRIAPHVAYWSVRAEADRARLIDLRVPPDRISVAADMAWLLTPAALNYGQSVLKAELETQRPIIGININAETNVMARAPRMMEDLARVLDDLVETHDAQAVFLFNEVREEDTFDLAAAKTVTGLMRRADRVRFTPNAYLTPHQMMSIIGCCTMTISTRYHFCLFSALQGVPFLPIKRSDKVADLSADLGWALGAAPEETAAIAAHGHALLRSPAPARAQLAGAVPRMRERAALNHEALDALHDVARSAKPIAWTKHAVRRGSARVARLVSRAP